MSQDDHAPFGRQLRLFRERAGLTQEELAERSGLSRDAISALERGRRRRPYQPTLNALADALELSEEERISLRISSRGSAPAPFPAQQPAHRARMPEMLTSLVGRSRELSGLTDLVLGRAGRLITITGPGGVGKTRLAVEMARSLADSFAGRTVFVPLGGVWDPDLVVPTVADALGIRDPGGDTLVDQIALVLGEQPMLVVLDNLEHVSDAASAIAGLVQASPSLVVVGTSRSPLRLSTEHVYPIEPLATGQADSAAVTLFVERARQTVPAFALTDRNREAVIAISHRLDGLPLAIELAAARTKVLPPDALLKRLDTGIDLLSSGPRDLVPRLQSVRSAIAWSYDLLDEREQAGFRALSVFNGEFTLQAAECVLEAVGFTAFDVIDLLSSLIDKSLVRGSQTDDTEPRYSMMFTIQRFGIGEMDASAESQTVHRAHARFILQESEVAADAFRNLTGPDQWPYFALLERERGNWRAALSWLHEHGETALMLRLTTALAWFWYVRGPIREGQFWLERAVAMPSETVPAELRPRALVAKGLMDMNSQRLPEARAVLLESLQTAPDPGEPWWIASAELFLGIVATNQGDYAFAEDSLHRAIATYHSIPHEINATIALGQLTAAAWGRGDLDRAHKIGIEAAATQRHLNDFWGLSRSLGYLALIAIERGDIDGALTCIRENLTIRNENVSAGDSVDSQVAGRGQWQAGVWQDVATSLSIVAVVMEALDERESALGWFTVADGIHRLLGSGGEQLPERAIFERTRNAVGRSDGKTGASMLTTNTVLIDAIAAVDAAISQQAIRPVS